MIKDWDDLNSEDYKNLLIGNGFSINISGQFSYPSLLSTFDTAKPIGRYWCTRKLFEKFDTTNFEEVLRGIYHAYLVSLDNEDAIKTLYEDLKNSLIQAVCNVHPIFNDIDTGRIAGEMLSYKSIYSTNYDLILYWSILDGDTDKFRDFFWGEGLSFDGNNTGIIGKKIPIYYLHGAVHWGDENLFVQNGSVFILLNIPELLATSRIERNI